jgi:alanine racemase
VDPYPRTWAEVDLDALSRNLQILKETASPAKVCLVAKADAYGHGLVPISRHAVREGVEALAVATVSEGIALREAGISLPILVLSPVLSVEVESAVFYELDLTLEHFDLAQEMAAAASRQGKQARFHLKVDTGLHRFGCRPSEALDLATRSMSLGLAFGGLSTHFIDSTAMEEATENQIRAFDHLVGEFIARGMRPHWFHCANSNGLVKREGAKHDLTRIGLHAYGIGGAPFMPVMALKTRVVAARTIQPGESVGYSATWRASRTTRVLTLGAGYGDGVPRALSSRGKVSIQGCLVPIIGLVCMDLMMVDGTEVPSAQVGDVATLLGEGITARDLAEWAGTNAHEIVTRIAPRVPRRFSARRSSTRPQSP